MNCRARREKFPPVEGWREGIIPPSDSQIAPVRVTPSGHVTVGMHTHVSRCLCKRLRGNRRVNAGQLCYGGARPAAINQRLPATLPSLGCRCSQGVET